MSNKSTIENLGGRVAAGFLAYGNDVDMEKERLPREGVSDGLKWTLSPARYAKGMVVFRQEGNQGMKGRGSRLAEGLRARWNHRDGGYVLSPSKARKLIEYMEKGWDASLIDWKLVPPNERLAAKVASTFMADAGVFVTRKQHDSVMPLDGAGQRVLQEMKSKWSLGGVIYFPRTPEEKQLVKRMTGSREAAFGRVARPHFLPPDAIEEPHPEADLMVYLYSLPNDKLGAIGYKGKGIKPVFHYHFRDEARRRQFVDATVEQYRAFKEKKEKARQERLDYRHGLKVGDILYTSWGYDQTNVDFYEVVEVMDKAVRIREIEGKVVSESAGSERVVAEPGKYKGLPMLKRVGRGDCVGIASYASACKWDGRPLHQTAMGYGH